MIVHLAARCRCVPVTSDVRQHVSKTSSSDTGISSHFRREAKLMLWIVGILVGLTVLLMVLGPWFLSHLQIDRCLDAGGRYNQQTKACEGEVKK